MSATERLPWQTPGFFRLWFAEGRQTQPGYAARPLEPGRFANEQSVGMIDPPAADLTSIPGRSPTSARSSARIAVRSNV